MIKEGKKEIKIYKIYKIKRELILFSLLSALF